MEEFENVLVVSWSTLIKSKRVKKRHKEFWNALKRSVMWKQGSTEILPSPSQKRKLFSELMKKHLKGYQR